MSQKNLRPIDFLSKEVLLPAIILIAIGLELGVMTLWIFAADAGEIPMAVRTPAAPEIQHSPLRTGIFDAGRVFGRAGCGDYRLAELVARHAARQNVPPRILAALVAVESHCNPLAVSHKGAVGLTQVRVSVWKEKYDFAKVNLFDADTSVRVGAEILGAEARRSDLRTALVRYNGTGPDAERYADKVLAVAGQ